MATRRQSASNAANPASATFGSTPIEGNLLKATAVERSGGDAGDYTISGSGWTSRISDTTEQGDANARRTHKVWTKIAGASEPTNVQVDNGTANTIHLLIEEFELDVGEDQFEFLEVASANSGTGSTSPQTSGTTASVSGTNFLVIGSAIWRTNGSDVADGAGISWSNSLADIVNAGTADSNGRAISSAYKDDTTEGTYESAVSWNGAGHECNAGILVFSTVAGGAANFNATGALAAQAAAVAGSAVVGRTSTGALASQAAAVAGAAVVGRTASAALAAQSATIAGTVTINRAASGALEAQAATISGEADASLAAPPTPAISTSSFRPDVSIGQFEIERRRKRKVADLFLLLLG